MSSKSEWTAVHERMMEEERQRLGPPPTAEQMAAYENGELPAEEEERMRALLVCYPDLARTLIRHDEPANGDADVLSKDELANDWEALQNRIRRDQDGGGKVVQFWRIAAAVAATLAVVFGGLLWRARSELGRPAIAFNEYPLPQDDGFRRGAGQTEPEVRPVGEHVLLSILYDGGAAYEQYRIEIVEAAINPGRKVWSSARQPSPDGLISILVPSRFLKPGSYKVVLYGAGRAREEKLATYPFRVAGTIAPTP